VSPDEILAAQARIRALSAELRTRRLMKNPGRRKDMTTEATGFHVQKAMCEVKLELARHGGITKDRTAPVGGGYQFRGIDDIYNVLCGLTAQHGINMYPVVVGEPKVEYQVTTKNGRNGERIEALQTHVHLLLEVKLVSAIDGSWDVIRTAGEAIDQGDKATNKAMSAAMKYACIMAFQIPVHGENIDIESHNVEVAPKAEPAEPKATRTRRTKAEEPEAPAPQSEAPKPAPGTREDVMSKLPVAGQVVPKATSLPRGNLLPVEPPPETRRTVETQEVEENTDAEPLDPAAFAKFAAPAADDTDWQLILSARADKTTSFGELFEIAEEADPKPEPARTAVFDHVFGRSSELIGLAPTLDALKEAKALIKSLGSPQQLLEAYNAKYSSFRSAAK